MCVYRLLLLLVQHIYYVQYIWLDCAIYDKSKTFGRQLQYAPRKILGYRDIADLSQGRNGSHFTKWLPMTYVDNVCMSNMAL